MAFYAILQAILIAALLPFKTYPIYYNGNIAQSIYSNSFD
jgi:hypothetical protein